MVKESSPANFSFLWGVEQGGSKENVILSLSVDNKTKYAMDPGIYFLFKTDKAEIIKKY